LALQFTPFQFLSAAELAYLLDRDHKTDKAIYIDCLALMHDVLASFSTNEEHSAFEVDWIKSKARNCMNSFQPQAGSVKSNVQTNLRSAIDMYGELTSGTRTVTRFVALTYVDAYLNDLLDQYRTIRYPSLP
jgi:hypothetical protein